MAEIPHLPGEADALANVAAHTLARIGKALARVGIHLPPPGAGAKLLEQAVEAALEEIPRRRLNPEVSGPLYGAVHTWLVAIDVIHVYLHDPADRRYRTVLDELAAAEVLAEVAMAAMDAMN